MDNPLSKVLSNTPPPPPLEVKIRTMKSDIESMMRSGGGAPSFQDVAVPGLSMEQEYKAPTSFRTPLSDAMAAPVPERVSQPMPAASLAPVSGHAQAPAASSAEPNLSTSSALSVDAAPVAAEAVPAITTGSESHLMPIIIVTLVALVAIAVVGYFAYTMFVK